MPEDRFLHSRAGHGERVNMLNDAEFRVWAQYLISADDFGVMRFSAVTIQADNDHLSNRKPAMVQRCLEAIKGRRLIRTFEHQGRTYCYQHDWQYWQKVNYPRRTNHPAPPPEALADCDEPTQDLFKLHPGGAGRKRTERLAMVLETDPDPLPERSSLMRADAPAKRLTANGQRLVANGSEGGLGETDPPMDVWARELVNLYPAVGRVKAGLVERPLFGALADIGGDPFAAWEFLKARLENHKRSHQWRVKGMVKRLDSWLREGLYHQELPEEPAGADAKKSAEDAIWEAAARGRSRQ